jgi:hypothetical protein
MHLLYSTLVLWQYSYRKQNVLTYCTYICKTSILVTYVFTSKFLKRQSRENQKGKKWNDRLDLAEQSPASVLLAAQSAIILHVRIYRRKFTQALI